MLAGGGTEKDLPSRVLCTPDLSGGFHRPSHDRTLFLPDSYQHWNENYPHCIDEIHLSRVAVDDVCVVRIFRFRCRTENKLSPLETIFPGFGLLSFIGCPLASSSSSDVEQPSIDRLTSGPATSFCRFSMKFFGQKSLERRPYPEKFFPVDQLLL